MSWQGPYEGGQAHIIHFVSHYTFRLMGKHKTRRGELSIHSANTQYHVLQICSRYIIQNIVLSHCGIHVKPHRIAHQHCVGLFDLITRVAERKK